MSRSSETDAETEASLKDEAGLFVGMAVLRDRAARLEIEKRQHDPFSGDNAAECLGEKLELGQFFFLDERHFVLFRVILERFRFTGK